MIEFVSIQADNPDLRELLTAENLPTKDLLGDQKQYFGIKNSQERLIAVGGLEICGSNAILRSCVVAVSHKGQHLGAKLIGHLVDTAKNMHLEHLYLLTETASGFFQKLGFTTINRDDVPERVANSAQFSEICPQSAIAMTLNLSA